MALCPSCGREVSSRQISCPYCGANLKHRMTIALFGILAIVLAVGGLVLLYVYASDTEVPNVRISEIQAAMNFAYIQIEGDVTRSPNYNPESESLTFWVDDDSGRMLVSAFRSEARALIDAGRVPALGDHVVVSGILRVRDALPSLILNSINALDLVRAIESPTTRSAATVLADDVFSAVNVHGQVRAVRQLSSGLQILTIRDESGEIDIVIDDDLEAIYGPVPRPHVGDTVDVTGIVTLFDNAPQVTLTRSDHLTTRDVPTDIAEPKSISDLDDADIDTWVRVQGTIARIDSFSAGVKFTLRGTRGRDVILLLWQDVFDALDDGDDWQIGAEVVAQGRVSSFRGELEILPELPLDVSVLTRVAVVEEPAFELIGIGTITQNSIGETVFISGTVSSVSQFNNGVRFILEDDSGAIQVVLFEDVFDQIADAEQLEPGTSVLTLGRVSEFNNALEVIPPNGGSVRVSVEIEVASVPTPTPTVSADSTPAATATLSSGTVLATATSTPGPTPAAPTATPQPAPGGVTAIGSIASSMIGQTISVRAQVVSTSSFSAGFRFVLNDGSGSITLVLFDGTYRAVADRAILNLGAQVRVDATVAEFNEQLQLQPESGDSIVVEQAGSTSIIKTRAINTLTSGDIGTLVAVVGDVVRVEGFAAGVSVFVSDGTGELRVAIFENVLNFVPNATALQAGATVRIVGRVDEFGGALELLPALGFDVSINP